MKITVDGKELDPNAEQELFANDEYGWNVAVTYTDDATEIYHNVTEIHWKYKSIPRGESTRVAIESDVHRTGGTIEINTINQLVAVRAYEMEKDF